MAEEKVKELCDCKQRRQTVVDRRLVLNSSRVRTKAKRAEANPDSRGEKLSERRGNERREELVDRRVSFDRRRGPGRRRSDERKAAEEGQMNDEQFEFLMAINDYKKQNRRPFPTWTEVLEVIKAIGYRKVADPQPLKSFKKEAPV